MAYHGMIWLLMKVIEKEIGMQTKIEVWKSLYKNAAEMMKIREFV
jgi:hypothetical protein